MSLRLTLTLTIFIVALSNTAAHAQLDNKPWSFRGTPNGGVGMSVGGMQAIINQKVLGATPENMVRGADGALLDVEKGPGGSALVSNPGGNVIPGYKGLSWKGTNTNMSVGTFNSYFSPAANTDAISSDYSYAHIHSGAVISTWTTRVVTDVPVSFLPGTPVDTWTSAAMSLN